MGLRFVSTRPPLSQQFEEEFDCLLLPREMMHPALTAGANATPSADKTGLAEQIRFNRHGVVTGHVLRGVLSFDIELVGLGDHDRQDRIRQIPCPTRNWNRLVLIDSWR